MLLFNENVARSMSRSLQLRATSDEVDDFLDELDIMVEDILTAMGEPNTLYEISTFGSYDREGIANEKEAINIAIDFQSIMLLENSENLSKYKSKRKKRKEAKLEEIKMLIILLLTRTYGKKIAISVLNNSIYIDSMRLLGHNFRIFVFTHSLNAPNDLIYLKSDDLSVSFFNLYNYQKNILNKNIKTKGNFDKICNVLKNVSLDYGILNDMLLIEAYIYNVPDDYFVGHINNQLFNVLNYLKVTSGSSLVSIDNESIKLMNNSFYTSNNITKSIVKMKELINVFGN